MKVARQVHIGCQQAARKGRGCRPATSARLPMAPTTSQARNAQIVQRIADCNRPRKPRAVLLACGSLAPRPRGQIADRLTAAATLHKHDQLFTGAYYALLLPAEAPHARCAALAGVRRRLRARSGTCSDPAATRRRGAEPSVNLVNSRPHGPQSAGARRTTALDARPLGPATQQARRSRQQQSHAWRVSRPLSVQQQLQLCGLHP